jgi:predicted nucleotidyltransferase component of viral defense system
MIRALELHRAAAEEGLRFDQAEKDYVILWLLYGLSHQALSTGGWIFKGGTCLRHCYYPGYRFSEDLDFSCLPDTAGLEAARPLLDRAAAWVQRTSGIRMATKAPQTIPGDFQVEIPVEYSRGGGRSRGLPCVRVHLTFDEPILAETESRSIEPRFSDLKNFKIITYSKIEIIAEKIRALLQQQKKWPRPRDLYDLWFILCRSGERFEPEEIRAFFVEKCRARKIEPDVAALTSDQLKEWNQEVWASRMAPMMRSVPDFNEVWRDWLLKAREIFH